VLGFKGLFVLTYSQPRFAPYFSWICVIQIWDIVFSPFGLEERMKSAFVLIVLLDLTQTAPPLYRPKDSVGKSMFRSRSTKRPRITGPIESVL
jgi:hypothetical protein